MYTSRAQIQAQIRAATLAEMLDDNRDGVEDVGLLDSIIAAAQLVVDAAVGASAAATAAQLPAVPAVLANAATMVACYNLFRRLPTKDAENPFKAAADAALKECEEVRNGTVVLAAGAAGAQGVMRPHLKFDDRHQEGL